MSIETIIIAVAAGLFLLWCLFSNEKKDHSYTAEFGDPGEVMSRWNQGFAIIGNKAITKKLSYENCFLCAPTGAGKSSVVIFSSLASIARGKSSMVINDVSSEFWQKSSYLADKGYHILRFDPSNAAQSESFNPLLLCKSVPDINKLALIIVRNALGESKGDPFWDNSSTMLIALMCRYLVFHADPKYCTLQNVLRLIEKFAVDGKAVDKLFAKTNNEALLDAYKATLVMGEKTLQSVIATSRTALQLFSDPEVCKATSTNTIDFSILRTKPVALFLNTPLKDLKYYKPLLCLFIQSLFDFVLAKLPKADDNSIFFLIDEFASMTFPDVGIVVSNIRKTKCGILICLQDEMALQARYGQAEAHQIKTNCGTKIFLKGQPLHTCKELSQICGKYTILDDNGNARGVRELMTPDEIRLCPDALILVNNNMPYRCPPKAYYENFWLRSLASAGPVTLHKRNVAAPELIQFN